MIDISQTLVKAARAREGWSEAAAHDFFRAVAQSQFAHVDWDEDAGEQWARFVRGSEVVAMAWVPASLVFADAELASDRVAIPVSELSVLVPSLGAIELTADRRCLSALHRDRVHSVALDSACLSAEDPWCATV